jgi:hypothetical protein
VVWVWVKGVCGLDETGEGEGDAAGCAKAVPANMRIRIDNKTGLIIGLLIPDIKGATTRFMLTDERGRDKWRPNFYV